MTEYWKSVGRKYCNFCKCWLTDNKVSWQTHEAGARHKAAVQQKLKQTRAKATEAKKNQEEAARMFKQMEKDALAAFSEKDHGRTSAHATLIGPSLPAAPTKSSNKKSSNKSKKGKGPQPQPPPVSLPVDNEEYWYELKDEYGHTYFQNAQTDEWQWQRPESGNIFAFDNDEEEEEKTPFYNAKVQKIVVKEEDVEPIDKKAWYYTEGDSVPKRCGRDVAYGEFRSKPSPPPLEDLELPVVNKFEVTLPQALQDPHEDDIPVLDLTEKVVEGVGEKTHSTTFKKTKIHNRNSRKRRDSD